MWVRFGNQQWGGGCLPATLATSLAPASMAMMLLTFPRQSSSVQLLVLDPSRTRVILTNHVCVHFIWLPWELSEMIPGITGDGGGWRGLALGIHGRLRRTWENVSGNWKKGSLTCEEWQETCRQRWQPFYIPGSQLWQCVLKFSSSQWQLLDFLLNQVWVRLWV